MVRVCNRCRASCRFVQFNDHEFKFDDDCAVVPLGKAPSGFRCLVDCKNTVNL